MSLALDRLLIFPLGTRVVVRYRVVEGSTDALGILVARDPSTVTIDTRAGSVQVKLDAVLLAKEVPPAPARRGSARP